MRPSGKLAAPALTALALEEPEPEHVKDDREQGEDCRYHPGDHPKTVELPLNGMPPTFMPQMLAISVAGRNITENIVRM